MTRGGIKAIRADRKVGKRHMEVLRRQDNSDNGGWCSCYLSKALEKSKWPQKC